jgi:hypothetical protein
MEYSALFLFFLCELAVALFVYFHWLLTRSGLGSAKSVFAKVVRDHQAQGTLEQYIQNVVSGEESPLPKRKWLLPYLKVLLSGMLGFLVVFYIKRFTGAGVALRTIVGILAVLPFVCLLAAEIAKETDDNRITDYQRSTARRLLEKIKEGSEDDLAELLQ